MKNQLQKDIQIALSWMHWIPYEKWTQHDQEAFERLDNYSNRELGYDTYNDELIDDCDKKDMQIASQEKQLQKQHRIITTQDQRITDLEKDLQDYEDNVADFFIEYWNQLTPEMKQTAHLELGIEINEEE